MTSAASQFAQWLRATWLPDPDCACPAVVDYPPPRLERALGTGDVITIAPMSDRFGPAGAGPTTGRGPTVARCDAGLEIWCDGVAPGAGVDDATHVERAREIARVVLVGLARWTDAYGYGFRPSDWSGELMLPAEGIIGARYVLRGSIGEAWHDAPFTFAAGAVGGAGDVRTVAEDGTILDIVSLTEVP